MPTPIQSVFAKHPWQTALQPLFVSLTDTLDFWESHAEATRRLQRINHEATDHACLFFLLLETNPPAFPTDCDPFLTYAIRHLTGPRWLALCPRLIPLFETMPAPRNTNFHTALVQRAVQLAIANTEHTQHFAPFPKEALAQFKRVYKAMCAPDANLQPHNAHGIHRLSNLLILAKNLGMAPPEDLAAVLERELREYNRRGLLNQTAAEPLQTTLAWLPEDQRGALMARQPFPLWPLIRLSPDPDFPTLTILKALTHDYYPRLEPSIDAHPDIDWVPHLRAALSETQKQGHRADICKQIVRHTLQKPLPEALETLSRLPLEAQHHLITDLARYLRPTSTQSAEIVFPTAPPEARVALARLLTVQSAEDGDPTRIERCKAQETNPRVLQALDAALDRLAPDWEALSDSLDRWLDGDDIFENPVRNEEAAWIRTTLKALDWPYGKLFIYEPLLSLALPECQKALASTARHMLRNAPQAIQKLNTEADLAALAHRPIADRREDYLQNAKAGRLSTTHHLRAVTEGSGAMQKQAALCFAALGEDALPHVLPLLKAKKASVRATTARILELIESPKAAQALKDAIAKEKSAKTRKVLENAFKACDTLAKTLEQASRGGIGVYKHTDAFTDSHGLEQLRAIFYAPPTPQSWVRLCDTVERFQTSGNLSIALDYIQGHGTDRWPEDERCQPWGWANSDALSKLGDLEFSPSFWLPVSAMRRPETRKSFLDTGLSAVEGKVRARKLPRDHIDTMLEWIERGWTWCEQEGFDLSALDIRMDGGSKRSMGTPQSTRLELWRGFGVRLARESAFGGRHGFGLAGMRWVKVKIHKDHILRTRHRHLITGQYLDLMPLLKTP